MTRVNIYQMASYFLYLEQNILMCQRELQTTFSSIYFGNLGVEVLWHSK